MVTATAFSAAESFSEGLAAVKIDDKWGYIDRSGKIVIEPLFGLAMKFRNGLAVVHDGGRVYYVNRTGEIISKRLDG